MTTIEQIEDATRAYAAARRRLADVVEGMNMEMQAIRDRLHLELKALSANAAQSLGELETLVEAAPELFERPRTITLEEIKVGYRKQRGQVSFADQERTIKRIRALLPAAQSELLIRVRESVHKPGVYDLTAADLKRLGITVEADSDVVVIAAVGGVDKLIDQMIASYSETSE